MEKSIFDKILVNDEYIMKIYKPNRKRYLLACIPMPVLMLVLLIGIPFPTLLYIQFVEKEPIDWGGLLPVYITFGLFIILIAIFIINLVVNSKNIAYCLTNRRLITKRKSRTEVFDFFELKDLSYSSVRSTRIDKMFHPNTGTIIFSNTQINLGIVKINRKPNTISMLSLVCIDDAFEVLKYIQGVADTIKKED